MKSTILLILAIVFITGAAACAAAYRVEARLELAPLAGACMVIGALLAIAGILTNKEKA